MLPFTGDHSENTIGLGMLLAVFNVRASPQMILRTRRYLTAIRQSRRWKINRRAAVFTQPSTDVDLVW